MPKLSKLQTSVAVAVVAVLSFLGWGGVSTIGAWAAQVMRSDPAPWEGHAQFVQYQTFQMQQGAATANAMCDLWRARVVEYQVQVARNPQDMFARAQLATALQWSNYYCNMKPPQRQ